jgi:hypothetical protein
MGRITRVLALVGLLLLAACDGGDAEDQVVQTPSDMSTEETNTTPAASVTVETPAEGATVSSPVKVRMAASGVAIEPAAEGVKPNSGHFHIIVDSDCVAVGQVIPSDPTHLHFGQAQTEADVQLSPGPHRLCVQVGDAAHTATDITKLVPVTVS